MNSEKRFLLFVMLTLSSVLGIQYLMEVTGLTPPPVKKPQNVVQAKKQAEGPGAKPPVQVSEKGPAPDKAAEAEAGKDREPGPGRRRRRGPHPGSRWPWRSPMS